MNKQSTAKIRKYISILFFLIILIYLLFQAYGIMKRMQLEREARALYESQLTTEELTTEEPSTQDPGVKTIQPAFIALREKYENDDIIGYLTIPGTKIDYPVVHTKDNDFYLEHDIKKEPSNAGWIYMDYENDVERDDPDPNTILYGHNMKAQIMFHELRYYVDKAYYEEHPTITFNTIYENNTWEIFSVMKAHVSFNYIQVFFDDREEYYDLAKQIKEKSLYDTGVDIAKEDRILLLSTCVSGSPDERWVVCAKLVTKNDE